MNATSPALLLALTCSALPSLAQTPSDYGFNWCTVGAPGNRASQLSEFPLAVNSIGAVPYEYRITQTDLSTTQYAEFVNAYAPFWQGSPYDYRLTGRFLDAIPQPGGGYHYQPADGFANTAADMSWQMAARVCNWLQNGKIDQAWAFESGVYDTSTFHFTGPNWSAQMTPSPGANYWIPSLDEFTKAAYYDPNKNGPGQGGYWLYPNKSDVPLTIGLPGQGGQTIGNLLSHSDPSYIYGAWDLGQYPSVQSPWGLIDISATIPCYTSFITSQSGATLAMGGSMAGDPEYLIEDRGDIFAVGHVMDGTLGTLRIASSVPAPSASVAFALMTIIFCKRRRTCGSS